MNPFQLSEQNGGYKVPCGKCLNCKRRRASSWSVRLVKEGERSISAHFLTLTYDTEHVPISDKGFMTLDKTHLQKFFKRLRKCHGKNHKSIKYYAVGEYGGKTLRPHYHMVIFNADVHLFERSWALDNKTIGQIHVGTITEASIGYTLKYISKASKIPLHKNDDRQKEFSLMSKGLGSNYLTKNMLQWHKNNPEERVYVPLLDGKKAPLPRYYKEKIFDVYEKEKIAFHFQKKATLSQELLVKEHGNNLASFLAEQYLNGLRKMNATDNTQKL
nr:MAG: replication initiator protein [Microvirus sp.]